MTARRKTDLIAELPDIDIEGGFEQQRREKDVKEGFGAQAEVPQPNQQIAKDAAGLISGRKIGDAADRDPDYSEQHGIRDRQSLRERQQQADEPEQGGNSKDGLYGFMHGARKEPIGSIFRSQGERLDQPSTVDRSAKFRSSSLRDAGAARFRYIPDLCR
jgi:hypothetical protein